MKKVMVLWCLLSAGLAFGQAPAMKKFSTMVGGDYVAITNPVAVMSNHLGAVVHLSQAQFNQITNTCAVATNALVHATNNAAIIANLDALKLNVTDGASTNQTIVSGSIIGNVLFDSYAFGWDSNLRTFSFDAGNGVTGNINHELWVNVMNHTGATITNGMVVRYAGTVGASGLRKGALMVANGSVLPGYTLGIATEDIPNGSMGKVTSYGIVRGLKTGGNPNLYGEDWSDLTNGAPVYVSTNKPGFLTRYEPQAWCGRKILIGSVDFVHQTQGFVSVRPKFYDRPEELDGVNGTTPTEGSLMVAHTNACGVTYYDFDRNLNEFVTTNGSSLMSYDSVLQTVGFNFFYTYNAGDFDLMTPGWYFSTGGVFQCSEQLGNKYTVYMRSTGLEFVKVNSDTSKSLSSFGYDGSIQWYQGADAFILSRDLCVFGDALWTFRDTSGSFEVAALSDVSPKLDRTNGTATNLTIIGGNVNGDTLIGAQSVTNLFATVHADPVWLLYTNVVGAVTLTNQVEAPIRTYGTGAVSIAFSGLRSPLPLYMVARGFDSVVFPGAYFIGGGSWQTNMANHFIVWTYGTNLLVNPVTATE